MKILTLLLAGLLAGMACFVSTGCEMHPPSETIPGYAEKEPAKQAIEKQRSLVPEGANTNAPTFFPTPAQE